MDDARRRSDSPKVPQDREDLLREATGLLPRIELDIGEPEPVVVGFRRDGSASFYFGQRFVVQFNAQGELRRAFLDGKLLKAERAALIELTRQPGREAVLMVRRPLGKGEQQAFLASVDQRLSALQNSLDSGAYTICGSVPDSPDVVPRVRSWLANQLSAPRRIAQQPGVK